MATKNIQYKGNSFSISYEILSNNAQKNMAILHGWGSNKELMQMAFGNYFKDFNHIYIDLPGFGASYNDIFIDTKDYAQILDLFLQKININNISNASVVMGHSYGGKIALLLNREIILLSSAGILHKKSFSTILKIKMAKILKTLKLNAKFLRANDAKTLSPAMYEVFKKIVNEDFSHYYKTFAQKASVFWGNEDKATPIKSFEVIKSLMPEARFFLLNGDHYFFLKQGEKISHLYKEQN